MPEKTEINEDVDGSTRVLVVEDEVLIGLFLMDSLESLGYECSGMARTAQEAFAVAESEKPAVALVDIGLQGSDDGIEVARTLIEKYGVSVVFLSGTNRAETIERAEALGPSGFLTKPCIEEEIVAALRQALAPKRTT